MAKRLLNLLAVFTVLFCLTFVLIVESNVLITVTVIWPEDSADAEDPVQNVPSPPVIPDYTESVIHIDVNRDGFDDNTGEYIGVP